MARALAASPRLLLMDEPLSSLDRPRKIEIFPYLESLHDELDIPVIYVSHSADEVARLADHLVLLKEGRVEAAGPVGQLMTRLDLPLAQGDEAEALIEGEVAGFDQNHHLTHVDSAAGRFTVVGTDFPSGRFIRLRVAARDVSLALSPPAETSILNIFPATVDAMRPEGKALVSVRLRVGDGVLLSCITAKSASDLGLEPEKKVFAPGKERSRAKGAFGAKRKSLRSRVKREKRAKARELGIRNEELGIGSWQGIILIVILVGRGQALIFDMSPC